MAVKTLLTTLPKAYLPWISLLCSLGVFFKQIGNILPLRSKCFMPSLKKKSRLNKQHLFASIYLKLIFRCHLITPDTAAAFSFQHSDVPLCYSLCVLNVEAGQSSMVTHDNRWKHGNTSCMSEWRGILAIIQLKAYRPPNRSSKASSSNS